MTTPANLSPQQAYELVHSAFCPTDRERRLALLVDLPDARLADNPSWADRRSLALEWRELLGQALARDGFDVALFAYPNVRRNNADLPDRAWAIGAALPDSADGLDGEGLPFDQVFAGHDLFMAPTELSTTAPLKVAARRHGFKAATMPGFSRSMMPALGLDIREVDRRCQILKGLLDRASGADFLFLADGEEHRLHLDLRHRTAHASSGLLAKPGTAGNLPSGETYIVPYEGENGGDASRSRGFLPVQLHDGEGGSDVVIYRVLENRAVGVRAAPGSPLGERESERLHRDPAYGNLAELGLGVLADFGVEPIGEVLLDEKLGPHIAFGRSDHFGGQTGPDAFASPDSVVHIDRVYLPSTQPRVEITHLDLAFPDRPSLPLVRRGAYTKDAFAGEVSGAWAASGAGAEPADEGEV